MSDVFRKETKELTNEQIGKVIKIKEAAEKLLLEIECFEVTDETSTGPESSRELSVAKTKLEESVMWATKHWTA